MAKMLAGTGASVTLVCRTERKCEVAMAEIWKLRPMAELDALVMDMADLSSVKKTGSAYASKVAKVDMLFLNAGVGSQGPGSTTPLSVDGIELVFATNHVGHHLLYKMLAPVMADGGRVVVTSSSVAFDSYDYGVALDLETLNHAFIDPGGLLPYAQSKLAQILWVQELTHRLGPNSSVFVNSFHPGLCSTGIFRNSPAPFNFILENVLSHIMWKPEQGALTGLYLGVEVGEKNQVRGQYLYPIALPMDPPDHARNLTLQRGLWEFTDRLVDRVAG
eukprot:TRINITY_DN56207_c0_g1_i3.p1 TRINITY_DN56207_c0_g1~~TRINITY_DN56207_c0_g1_i3.p1  ORF type:complete len:276 (+),score=64.03 TRINITY_DN56207_c0_g1_i3:265-1092(+)